MIGRETNRIVARCSASLSAFALLAAMAPPAADAEAPARVAASDEDASADTEAAFEAAFAAVPPPVTPTVPPHAVDITTIEPATPPEPAATTLGTGMASYYGRRFHGRRTANGERFDMAAMTAAHRTLPFGSRVRVTNPRNGRSVVVRINDRGPFVRGRTIDVSRGAAEQLGMVNAGHARVELELIES